MRKISENLDKILVIVAVVLSITSFLYFFQNNHLNIEFYDAQARLNIARKVIDNLTPGIAQLGNIWLPLPQVLMLPFIWSNFLWHSGIAGYIMSGISFVLTIYFLYKIGIIAFGSRFSGFAMALVALTSINFVYMQTTPMTETLFIATVTGATYYLLKWAKYQSLNSLLLAAFFISASTLTRYEGYFVFLMATFLVSLILLLKTKDRKKTEGTLILFGTLAVTGIVMWIIYSWTIFKDPTYWIKIYSHEVSIISTDKVIQKTVIDSASRFSQKGNLINSVTSFSESVALMVGIPITIFAAFGLLAFIPLNLKRIFTDKPYYLVLFLPFSVFAFVVFTLYRGGIPLGLPHLDFGSLLNRNVSLETEYNIRYGLTILPLVAIFFGWLAVNRFKLVRLLLILIIVFQVVTTFYTPLFTVYQLPTQLAHGTKSIPRGNTAASSWLKENYNGGLIMISALQFDPEMFYLGLDYKNYIHEGTGNYWLDSTKNPQKHASWIYMSSPENYDKDQVRKNLAENKDLIRYFDLVYQDKNNYVYKKKI